MEHRLLKTVHVLKNHPLIERIRLGNYRISIEYKTGVKEHWIHKAGPDTKRNSYDLPSRDLFGGKEISICREFETNPLDDNYHSLLPFFMLQTKDLKKASFINRRFVVQELITQLSSEGWIEPTYPINNIKEDIFLIGLVPLRHHTINKILSIYGSHGASRLPGKLAVEHFFDIGDIRERGAKTLRELWESSYDLYRAIKMSTDRPSNLTRGQLLRNIYTTSGRMAAGPKIIPASFYCHLFRVLRIDGIIDRDPGYGSKALAAHVLGIGYFGDLNEKLSNYLKNEETSNSIIIDDNSFVNRKSRDIIPRIGNLPIAIYVPNAAMSAVENFKKPSKKIAIIATPRFYGAHTTGYFFIYN